MKVDRKKLIAEDRDAEDARSIKERPSAQARLEQLLLDGLESRELIEVTKEYLEQRRKDLWDQLKSSTAGKK